MEVAPRQTLFALLHTVDKGCIFRLTCSHHGTKDNVLTSAYVEIFRTVTRNAVNKSVWRKKDCSWLPLNKYAMNIWLSFLRIRAHLSWRTGKTSPCSPCVPNLLHVLPSRMLGWNKLCNPVIIKAEIKASITIAKYCYCHGQQQSRDKYHHATSSLSTSSSP